MDTLLSTMKPSQVCKIHMMLSKLLEPDFMLYICGSSITSEKVMDLPRLLRSKFSSCIVNNCLETKIDSPFALDILFDDCKIVELNTCI